MTSGTDNTGNEEKVAVQTSVVELAAVAAAVERISRIVSIGIADAKDSALMPANSIIESGKTVGTACLLAFSIVLESEIDNGPILAGMEVAGPADVSSSTFEAEILGDMVIIAGS